MPTMPPARSSTLCSRAWCSSRGYKRSSPFYKQLSYNFMLRCLMGAMNVTVDRVKTIRVMTGGLGFGGALCLLLLGLKLTVSPQIPWLAVVAAPFIPVTIAFAMVLAVMVLIAASLALMGIIAAVVSRRK